LSSGHPPGCALSATDLGAARVHPQAPGDRDEALAALDAAAAEAEQLGMVPFTEWIEQLRVRPPAAPAGGSPLSPRELEVARHDRCGVGQRVHRV
jgi:hypothetical protein